MKKSIIFLATICAAAVGLCACNSSCYADEPMSAVDAYEDINNKLAQSYSKIDLKVTNTFDEANALTSQYKMSFTDSGVTVEYSIEKFASLSLDDDADNKYKATTTGTAVIKDGKVIKLNQNDVDISADVVEKGFSFKAEYFSAIKLSAGSLEADVTDAKNFFGRQITCTNAKVCVSFNDVLQKLTFSYTDENGVAVVCEYTFTR